MEQDHKYLVGRGIPQDVAVEFGIGVANDRCYFPVVNCYGEYAGYASRVLEDTKNNFAVRYDFSNLDKSNHLYNYHRASQLQNRAVLVVEGFFGLMRVYQAGYKSVVALMGSIMSARQEHLLSRWWDIVILMMDGDKAGRVANKELSLRLSKTFKAVYSIELPDGVQPDHWTPAQIKNYVMSSR